LLILFTASDDTTYHKVVNKALCIYCIENPLIMHYKYGQNSKKVLPSTFDLYLQGHHMTDDKSWRFFNLTFTSHRSGEGSN